MIGLDKLQWLLLIGLRQPGVKCRKYISFALVIGSLETLRSVGIALRVRYRRSGSLLEVGMSLAAVLTGNAIGESPWDGWSADVKAEGGRYS